MINSRSLDDLQPVVAAKARAFIADCTEAGIALLVTSTYRDFESQQTLYQQGRTAPGNRVTNAMPGDSAHNYGLAFDIVPLRAGKPVWDTQTDQDHALWEKLGELGEARGLEWAGRWRTFQEFAHFQDLGDLKLPDLKLATMQQAAVLNNAQPPVSVPGNLGFLVAAHAGKVMPAETFAPKAAA